MIYVVGCDHDIQSSDPVACLEGSPALKQQRDHFRQLVERILSDVKVELVAEEWGRESESFAEALAKKHTVRYVNTNTNSEDLDALEIPSDYTNPIKYTAAQIEAWLQQREGFMLGKICCARGTAKTLLVICGFRHLGPLAEQLGNGERVIPVDYRKEKWYRDDLFFPVSF
jgi:hypothetical protein